MVSIDELLYESPGKFIETPSSLTATAEATAKLNNTANYEENMTNWCVEHVDSTLGPWSAYVDTLDVVCKNEPFARRRQVYF